MTLGGVTPALVATLYPLAPVVSVADVQAGSDWAEIENAGQPLPDPASVQYRELQRAVAAYSLYLVTGGRGASARSSSTVSGGTVKSFQVGPVKLERTAIDGEALAEGLALGAATWLEIAGRHLAGAGILIAWGFPGTSR